VGQHVVEFLREQQSLLVFSSPLLLRCDTLAFGRLHPANSNQLGDRQHEGRPTGDERQPDECQTVRS
jgi:hypothetical protein